MVVPLHNDSLKKIIFGFALIDATLLLGLLCVGFNFCLNFGAVGDFDVA